ncbi:hypothetical protein MATL_G00185510 [Megalops atlanticus]|uniref:WD repeat- and FYVE domain-containing protein 4 n=1 Tax=Megalops atlanticus TaxID=7932 RepID=A0A9D3T1B1_MEGAT|nr:hypothetical protein MATL_G00185510 [Megalops atlanticus]
MAEINKETGELSALRETAGPPGPMGDQDLSGQPHRVSPEAADPSPVLTLRDQLFVLETNSQRPIQEREDDILKVLPLFIEVSQSGEGEELNLQGLASQVAEVVVFNIQQKLSEKPAEEARHEVEQFFEGKGEVRETRGWLLLKSLSLLSAGESDIVTTIIKSGLPAALVKCLYLFVALPPRKGNAEEESASCSFQEVFTQVLLQLCRQVCCVEELVETRELQCLIIALTSLWDQCSSAWRRQASRLLRAVSAAQARSTVPALQAKNCIKICIQNMLKITQQVAGPVLAEVAVSVFSFVKDSYPFNPALFEEFESNEGYRVLQMIMSRCEDGVTAEDVGPLEELLDLIASLTLCGRAELKVAVCVNNPQPPGFKFDPVLTKGSSVKNLTAFRIIHSSFLRSENVYTCSQILRTIQNIWTWDKANFFLLEWTLQSLAQLAECVWRKPPPVHALFFELVEAVVSQLSYIPHETLKKVQGIFHQGLSVPFNVAALDCYHRLCGRSGLFCEVLSDSGMLELLLAELKQQAKVLRKAGVTGNNDQETDEKRDEKTLTVNMLKVVATLAMKSVRNTVAIRDYGMIPYIKIFLDDEQLRGHALSVLEQLSEINADEYMSTTIGALCSSTESELSLKQSLLQSILKVLKSPSTWNAFRNAGGFNGLLSVIVDMEGALSARPPGPWASLRHSDIMDLILLTLHTVALAVHLYPVNEHFFHTTGQYERLADALLQLGCFQGGSLGACGANLTPDRSRTFHELVEAAERPGAAVATPLQDCIRLLSYLDQLATGTLVSLDFASEPEENPECPEDLPLEHLPAEEDPLWRGRSPSSSISSVTNDFGNRLTFDQIILHPGAVCVIMTLLPKIFCQDDPQLSAELQFAVADYVQSLVKSEQNRQIMCESGLLLTLLTHCKAVLISSDHPLHLPVVRVFEKLASQAVDHVSLRKFLCLGHPFMCAAENDLPSAQKADPLMTAPVSNGHDADVTGVPVSDEAKPSSRDLKRSFSLLNKNVGPGIPPHQIVSLISMTSPRSFRPHKLSVSPSFVEFDMSDSGYGCLFLPSLATVKGVSADSISTGGIGCDCRGFPPSAGLSFSCWFLIGRFSSACDSHPIRLLTVVRHMSRAEQQFVCLSVSISAPDGCLVISTEEEAYQFLDMMEPEVHTPTPLSASVRFKCAKQLVPGQWHHLVVVLAKDIKKSCKLTAYLNGKMFGVAKMKYIQPFPGQCISMDPTAVIDVCGIIGTPSLWKQRTSLIWRVGPTYLFEEALTSESVEVMHAQGTKYLGNYLSLTPQASGTDSDATPFRIVPEERISFGFNPAVSTITTVAEIRELYNEVDCRLIAKEIGITSRDNCTPVYLARNIAQHLSGTARTIGAALVGHFGVRTFVSNSAADSFLYIGGPTVILSLVAMAVDDNSMYAATKVLLSALSTSPSLEKEMNRIHGYKLLAFLLKMKSGLISHRTFQLILSIVGTLELGSSSIYVQNLSAFRDILCDFEVWESAPDNLDLLVLNHFADILKSSSGDPRNAEVMHRLNVTTKLLFLLNEPTLTCRKASLISTIIQRLLSGYFNTKDVCRLGLFLVYTLLPPSLNENTIFSGIVFDVSSQALSQTPARTVWIRNQLLEMLFSLISSDTALSAKQQEEIFFALGPDWFLLFIQSHLHSSTVTLGFRLLTEFLSHPTVVTKFRDGISPGTLVEKMAEEPLAVMDNLKTHSWSFECVSYTSPGFDVLRKLLISHAKVPQIYALLAALLLRRTGYESLAGEKELDEVLQGVIDWANDASGQQLCADAATVLLELVKAIISKPLSRTEDSWEIRHPGSVMQFFCLVHSLHPRDPLWGSPDFLKVLAESVFPPDSQESCAAAPWQDGGIAPPPEAPLPRAMHPARKQVFDFIRILLMDSLINVPAKNGLHPFVLLLEFSPEAATQEQKQTFQTEVLESLMDIVHMTCQEEGQSTHVARDDVKASNTRQDGKMATLIENVAFFSKKLVEKLYSGMFVADPEKILVFIAEQIVVVMEKAQSLREKTISVLYNSANRATLYFLSRPRQTLAERQVTVQTLRVLQQQWDVLLATYNANVNFLTCLLHCLLLLKSGSYPDGFGCETHKKQHKKIWSHLLPRKNSHMSEAGEAGEAGEAVETPDSAEVESELAALLESTWRRLMLERRHSLEEAYKMELSAKQGGREGPPGIGDISPLWEETALKAWQLFIDSQKKKMTNANQKKSSALSAAVRSAQRKLGKDTTCTVEEYLMCMEAHRKTGQEMFESLLKNHIQMLHCENDRMADQWQRAEEELLRERGLFGPGPGVFLKRGWVQDTAEGPSRMRPRIRRKAVRRSKKFPASSLGLYMKCNFVEENRGIAESGEPDSEVRILCEAGQEAEENGLDCEQLTFFPSLSDATPTSEDAPDFSQQCTETQVILQELVEGEEVKGKLCVVIVNGHIITEGVLLFGKNDFYICEGFTLSLTGDVCCKSHHPTSSVRDSFICSLFSKESPASSPSCRRYPYREIKEAHIMRFLLEDNALEILMRNGQSAFLVFQNKEHIPAFKRLCSVVPSLKGRGVTEAIINVRKNAGGDKTALHKWQKGEMSNFEYLMHLNTLAGRTYNDLMQYPVFPWVLADHDSETLDLTSPSTSRDLSKPMGAQTEKRKEKFVQRYNDVEGTEGDLAVRCHYCTHYSSAIIVALFLVRMEPFSQTFLSLQGGSFDVADRMFHSVKKEWESASRENMSDVRELIPEFYYLPDFLVNSNNFELGRMQDGTSLGDVVLPPWAKGDPQEFIRMHREALESDYVSAHLHLWIDLIFGFRQQGPAAVEAVNTFHPYFYAERMDADSLKDPLKKSTVLGFVSNFGQIPKQLFTKPHPPRMAHKGSLTKETSGPNHLPPFFFRLDKLKPSVQPVKELIRGPVGHMVCGEKEILAVEKNKLLIPPLWNTFFSWGFHDNTCAFGNHGTEKNFAVCESLTDWGESLCAACPNPTTVITGGTGTVVCVWEISISKDKLKHMRLKQALYGHVDAVTCLAASEAYSVIVSGSRDRTCILWDLEELSYITQLPGHSASLTALAINDLTGEIATCAGAHLYLWTMKGQLLSSIDTSFGPEGAILCCCFTQKHEWDSRNVIVTGCADGIVRIWKTEYTKAQLPAHQEEPLPQGDHRPADSGKADAPGKGWERHLVLCLELNRSQAVSRRRYKNNPAVTALAIPRSHGALLVGDAWGRVFCWTCEV